MCTNFIIKQIIMFNNTGAMFRLPNFQKTDVYRSNISLLRSIKDTSRDKLEYSNTHKLNTTFKTKLAPKP